MTIQNENLRSMNLNESIEISHPLPIIQPAGFLKEEYLKLSDKVFSAFRHVYKHYNDYKWYLKADDDTFVFVDNLKHFLQTKDPDGNLTYGYNYKEDYHAGAGYVLGNKAMRSFGKVLDENITQCSNSGYEDQDVSGCLRMLNVSMGKSLDDLNRERFHVFPAETCLNGTYEEWFYGWSQNNVTGVSAPIDFVLKRGK
jgi:glycoprotein-N-acetylgalactosamine 3-beta-galactosyltransferase